MNDGSGNFATRPLIASAPTTIAPGTPFTLTMADNSTVAAVNLIRLGQVTHSTSLQSRFVSASFSQTGQVVTITPTANVNDLLTGYWMVFVFNTSGTPAIAPIVQVPPPG